MVVHDLRNPAESIQEGLKLVEKKHSVLFKDIIAKTKEFFENQVNPLKSEEEGHEEILNLSNDQMSLIEEIEESGMIQELLDDQIEDFPDNVDEFSELKLPRQFG